MCFLTPLGLLFSVGVTISILERTLKLREVKWLPQGPRAIKGNNGLIAKATLFFTTPSVPIDGKSELRRMSQVGLWSYQGGLFWKFGGMVNNSLTSAKGKRKETKKVLGWAKCSPPLCARKWSREVSSSKQSQLSLTVATCVSDKPEIR